MFLFVFTVEKKKLVKSQTWQRKAVASVLTTRNYSGVWKEVLQPLP